MSARLLRGAQEIDGTGRYLLPGLIDSHVHLAVPPGFPAGMTADEAAAYPGLVAAALRQEPRSYLFFGFTTVVDLVGTRERTGRWNAQAVARTPFSAAAPCSSTTSCAACFIPSSPIRFPWMNGSHR